MQQASYLPKRELYVLDHDHTSVVSSTSHSEFSRYTVRFDKISRVLDFYPATHTRGRIDIVIDSASVSIGGQEWDETLVSADQIYLE